jgi:hypothetical protein
LHRMKIADLKIHGVEIDRSVLERYRA